MGKSDRISLSIVALGLGILPLLLVIGSLPSDAMAQGEATPTPTSIVWLGSAISGSGSRAAGQDAVNLLLNYTVPSNNYGYGYVVLRKSDTGTWQHIRTIGGNQIDPNSAACWFKANLANVPGFGGNDNNYWCNWAINQIVERGYTVSGNINATWSDAAYSPGSTVSAGERITCPDYQNGQNGVQCNQGSSSHEFYVFPLYYGWPPQSTVTPTVSPTPTITPTIPVTCTNVLIDGGMEQFPLSSAWTEWGYADGISKFGRLPASLMDSVLNGGPACETRFQLIGWWPNLFSSPVNFGRKIYQDFNWPGGDMYWKFQARSNYRLLRFGEHNDARAEVSIQYVTNQGSERVAYPYDTLINEPVPEDWNEYSGVIEDVPEGIYSIYLNGRYENINDIDRWTVYFDDVAISNCPLVGNCTLQTTPVYTPTSTIAPCDIPDLLNPDFFDDANNVTSLAYWSYASNETFALDPAAIPNGNNYEGVIAVGHSIGIRQNFRITNLCGDGMLYVRTRGSGGAIISLRNLDTGQEYTQPGYDYGYMIMNYGLVGFRVPPGNYRLKILPWSSSQQYSYLWLDYVCLKMGDYSGYSECDNESGNATATSSITPGTPIPTPTPRPSRTPTQGPTRTPTPTNTAIPTITPFPTWTPKATWTASAVPPTRTPTPTYPPTNTSAPTHTDEPTDTPSSSDTPTPRATKTPPPTNTPWPTYTGVPPTYTPTWEPPEPPQQPPPACYAACIKPNLWDYLLGRVNIEWEEEPDDEWQLSLFNIIRLGFQILESNITRTTSGISAYIAAYVDYQRCLALSFIVWCPEHSAAIIALPTELADKEPFGTINEVNQSYDAIATLAATYAWSETGISDESGNPLVEPDVIPSWSDWIPSADNIWNGGQIQLEVGQETARMDCDFGLKPFVGKYIGAGMCWLFYTMDDLGVLSWLQFFVNVIAIISLPVYMKRRWIDAGMDDDS